MQQSCGAAPGFSLGAFDAFPANVAVLDRAGDIVAVNHAWIEFAGANGGDSSIGQNYLAICRATTGDDREVALHTADGIEAVLDGQRASFELEYPCHSPTEERHFFLRAAPFVQGDERFVVVLHHNITQRKRAELEVQALNRTLEIRVQERTQSLQAVQDLLERQNHELERHNSELAQFASIASHDLQEPLRLLGLYADVLRHRWQGKLDDRADEHLKIMVEQVVRARQMVRDILTFADVKAMPIQPEVQVGDVWASVVSTLPWPADATYTVGKLPAIQANATQIRQLLTNLLGNAIKFRAERPLHVHLSGVQEDQWVHFVLSDNGIGVPADKRAHVFSMFSRLNSRSQFQGNGIGLAVCQRIVERHQGRIWLGGDGPGVEVHFTLPVAVSSTDE